MVRLYTRTGDEGETFCFALGSRVKKYHPIIEFLGSIDEANSFLGLAVEECREECGDEEAQILEWMQFLLFKVGFSLGGTKKFEGNEVELLEEIADKYAGRVELKGFVLPGGTRASSAINVARAVVRRAERRFFQVVDSGVLERNEQLEYAGRVLNRMSDALFAIAVWAAHKAGKLRYL